MQRDFWRTSLALLAPIILAACGNDERSQVLTDTGLPDSGQPDVDTLQDVPVVDFAMSPWTSTRLSCGDSTVEERQRDFVNSWDNFTVLRWGDMQWRTTHPERRSEACQNVPRSLYADGVITLSGGTLSPELTVRISYTQLLETLNIVPVEEHGPETMRFAAGPQFPETGCLAQPASPRCMTTVPDDLQILALVRIERDIDENVVSLTPLIFSLTPDEVWFAESNFGCSGLDEPLQLGADVPGPGGSFAVPVQLTWDEAVRRFDDLVRELAPQPVTRPVEYVDWDADRQVIRADHFCGNDSCCSPE